MATTKKNGAEKRDTDKKNDFITVDDLSKKGNTKAKITGNGIRIWTFRNGGANLILEVQIGPTTYKDLSMKIGMPSHTTIERLHGKDISKWAGQWIELYQNEKWVNVFDPNFVPNSGGARTKKSDLPF